MANKKHSHQTICEVMSEAEPEEIAVGLELFGEAVRFVALAGALQAPDLTVYMHAVRVVTLSQLRAWSGGSKLGIDAEARVTHYVMSSVEHLLNLAEKDAVATAKMREEDDG